jgi:DNA-binding transcriptional ArsR family regulator
MKCRCRILQAWRPSALAAQSPEPDVARVAALIGDPARGAMLLALLDGRALPASELARRGGVSPQAASAHLAKLVEGGLLSVRRDGRHRLYALRAPDVGYALEALAALAPQVRIVALQQNRVAGRMRDARSCHDHLAGRLGVAVTDALLARGVLRLQDEAFEVTRAGEAFLRELGIETRVLRMQRRAFARVCVDWTERRPHLAGSLGAALRTCFLENAWVERSPGDRSLALTEAGRAAILARFDCTL